MGLVVEEVRDFCVDLLVTFARVECWDVEGGLGDGGGDGRGCVAFHV